MFNDTELNEYCQQHKLTTAAIDYINRVRNNEPDRPTGDHALLNMSGRLASTKMNRTIQAESRTGEFTYVAEAEINPDVFEFWDQPCPIQLLRPRPIRGFHVSSYTGDYLTLHKFGPLIVECKSYNDICKLVKEKPKDWAVTENGVAFLPARDACQKIGLTHKVIVSERYSAIRVSNLESLLAHRYIQNPKNESTLLKRISTILADGPKTIFEICNEISGITHSMVLHWISCGIFHSCLSSILLTHSEYSFVYLDADEALEKDLYLRKLWLQSEAALQSANLSLVLTASKKAVQIATNLMQKYLETLHPQLRAMTRHERRFPREKIIACLNQDGNPLEFFIPDFHSRGNSVPRLTPEQIILFNQSLKELIREGKSIKPSHILARCDNLVDSDGYLNVMAPSLESIRLLLKKEEQEKIALAIGGIRAYHALKPPVDPADGTLRTTIPGLICHIDSTQWDQKLWEKLPISQVLACPWLYVAIDEATGKCIGRALGFGKSDTFALACCIRDIYRRIGFIPNFIITDRGSEYQSEFFEILCAVAGVNTFLRPAGGARYSAEVENSLKIANESVAQRLSGSMIYDRAGRSADGKKKAQHTARFMYGLAVEALDWFYFEHFNTVKHGTASSSPDGLWETGRFEYPQVGRHAPSDEFSWKIATSVPVKKGITLDPLKGIRTHYRTYFSDELKRKFRDNEKYDAVSIDPETPTVMYVKYGKDYVVARDRKHQAIISLPLIAQTADQFLLRDQRNTNRIEGRGARAKLDTRLDQLEKQASHNKFSAESSENEAHSDKIHDALFSNIALNTPLTTMEALI